MWGWIDEAAIGERFRALAGELDERQRRLWAAAEARSAGGVGSRRPHGRRVSRRTRSGRGLQSSGLVSGWGRRRVRRAGGGRKRVAESDPDVWWWIWRGWWMAVRAGIRSCRCGGRRRACVSSRWRWWAGSQGQLSHRREVAASAWLQTAGESQDAEGAIIPIATRSSSRSTRPSRSRWRPASR